MLFSSDSPQQKLSDLGFLLRYDTVPRDGRRLYVEQEMERVTLAGIHPMHARFYCVLPEQADAAMGWIRSNHPQVKLRLVAGAKPPECDAHGWQLPEGKRGEVLACKVGNIAHPTAVQGADAERQTGPARSNMVRSRRPIYRHVEVARTPKIFSADDAALVLAQFGAYIAPEFSGRNVERRTRWLVEPVDMDAVESAPSPITPASGPSQPVAPQEGRNQNTRDQRRA